jgi:hypothetical protein
MIIEYPARILLLRSCARPERRGRNGITGQAMLGTSRVKWRRWTTTLAALLAVAVAADPRLAHLAFCPANSPSAQSDPQADCEPDETCCPTDSAPPAQAVDFYLAIGTCGCCSHAPAGHQREPDARSAFVSSALLKAELGAATPSFSPLRDVPPSAFASPTPPLRTAASTPLILYSAITF